MKMLRESCTAFNSIQKTVFSYEKKKKEINSPHKIYPSNVPLASKYMQEMAACSELLYTCLLNVLTFATVCAADKDRWYLNRFPKSKGNSEK